MSLTRSTNYTNCGCGTRIRCSSRSWALAPRSVKIEYSLDGNAWTELEGVPEFAQATGLPTYTHNTTVSFGGAVAKYVKLTIAKSWGGMIDPDESERGAVLLRARAGP